MYQVTSDSSFKRDVTNRERKLATEQYVHLKTLHRETPRAIYDTPYLNPKFQTEN